MAKREIIERVYISLKNSNFNDFEKNYIANMIEELGHQHPNIDLNNLFVGLSYNSGYIFNAENFSQNPQWGAYYLGPYYDNNGWHNSNIYFRNENERDFSNPQFGENFTHEMIHSLASEKISDKNPCTNTGLSSKYVKINELFTEFYATNIYNSLFSPLKKMKPFEFTDLEGFNLSIPYKTLGYTYFTSFGNLIDFMYGEKIASDMFNHTNLIEEAGLGLLFNSFESSIENVETNPSYRNYEKCVDALTLLTADYLGKNIDNISLRDYHKMRKMFKEAMPKVNNELMGEEQLKSLDSYFYSNHSKLGIVKKLFNRGTDKSEAPTYSEFDKILERDAFEKLNILNNPLVSDNNFEKIILRFANKLNLENIQDRNDFDTMIAFNNLKDCTGKNTTYLLLKNESKSCDIASFIYYTKHIEQFLEKDNTNKDFLDYCLENNKPEYFVSFIKNSNIKDLESILKDHKESIYKYPDVFFEAIKDSAYLSKDSQELKSFIKIVDNTIDLKNLRDKDGNNISNYFEKDNLSVKSFFREYINDISSYKSELRKALVENNISYSDSNNRGISAFDCYLYYNNFSEQNLNELKSIIKSEVNLNTNYLYQIVPVIDTEIINILEHKNFDFNSDKGKELLKAFFSDITVSEVKKLDVFLSSDEIKSSDIGINFFNNLYENCSNKISFEINGLSDLFKRLSDSGINLNDIKIKGSTVSDILASKGQFEDIKYLVNNSNLDLFAKDANGHILINKLTRAGLDNSYFQDLFYSLNDKNEFYAQKIISDSNLDIHSKLQTLQNLKEIGFNFNYISEMGKGIASSICLNENSASPIVGFLVQNGYDIWQKDLLNKTSCVDYMINGNLSEAIGICALHKRDFIDDLFTKTIDGQTSYFDKIVNDRKFEILGEIIEMNPRMIDKILESDNPKKLEIIREISEECPKILDTLVRNDNFNLLDNCDKIEILINNGSVDKLYRERDFESLSTFAELKPSCIESIKSHPSFDSSPIDFRTSIICKDKPLDMDSEELNKKCLALNEIVKDKEKTVDLDV